MKLRQKQKQKNNEVIKMLAPRIKYNPETGKFIWAVKPGKSMVAGAKAGRRHKLGYIAISYKTTRVYAHRLAYYIIHGEIPECVDHIDGNPSNNRIENLRGVDHYMNMRNMKCHRKGRLLGTYFANNRWMSRKWNGKEQLYVGCFKTELEAHEAWKKFNV